MAVVEVVEAPAVAAVAVAAAAAAATAAAAVAGPAYSVLRCSPFTPTSVSLRFPPSSCLSRPSHSLFLSPCAHPRLPLSTIEPSHSFPFSFPLAPPERTSPFLPPSLAPTHVRFLSFCVPRLPSFSATLVSSPSFHAFVPRLSLRPSSSPASHTHRSPLSPSFTPSFFFLLRTSLVLLILHFRLFFLRLSSSRSRPRIADERFDGANRSPAIDGKSWHAPQRSIEIDRS